MVDEHVRLRESLTLAGLDPDQLAEFTRITEVEQSPAGAGLTAEGAGEPEV